MMLPSPLRVRKPREFSQIYKLGQQAQTPHLRLFSLGTDQNISRFGFVVSKKQVSKIVARNRTKRILRAHVREVLPVLRRGLNVIIQAKAGIGELSPAEIRRELTVLLGKSKILEKHV